MTERVVGNMERDEQKVDDQEAEIVVNLKIEKARKLQELEITVGQEKARQYL